MSEGIKRPEKVSRDLHLLRQQLTGGLALEPNDTVQSRFQGLLQGEKSKFKQEVAERIQFLVATIDSGISGTDAQEFQRKLLDARKILLIIGSNE